MEDLVPIDLEDAVGTLSQQARGRTVLWQDSQSLAFLSRGRAGRRDFHVDPSEEINLQLRGEQRLHYITPEGEQRVAILRPGQMLVTPAGVPHSPRVSDDAFFVVIEGVRKPGEQDRFFWLCEQCGEKVYEATATVGDYSQDVVSEVLAHFYADINLRTCRRCGWIVPIPPA